MPIVSSDPSSVPPTGRGADRSRLRPAGESREWLRVTARVLLAALGVYAASSAVVAALSAELPLTGFPRAEGVELATMLGFVVFLVLLLWSFAERRLARLGLGLALLTGGGFGLVFLLRGAG
jgi:hypothetical protein